MADVIDTTATEVAEPEAVEPGTQVQVLATAEADARRAGHDVAADALALATQHVIDNPGIAGRDEFFSIAAQARMLSLSGAAPKLVQENPYIAFHLAMAGRDLGISPTAAIELIDVIDTGKGPQLSLSPQLRLAQVRKKGLGDIRPKERTATRCVASIIDARGVEIGESEFTWEDAQLAGIAGPQCQPGAHVKERRQGRNGSSYERCPCNQGYITYPKRMLWWRAVGYGCDDYFPEASLGLYSPEELGAVVDEDGRPIDVATAELPPGYVDPGEARRRQQAQRDAPASDEDIADLLARIKALPKPLRDELGENWHRDGSRLQGIPVQQTPASKLKAARAMVNAFWGRAQSDGVDMDAALAAVVAARDAQPAADGAQEAPEADGGTEGADTPPEARQGEPGPADATPAEPAPAAAPVNQADVPIDAPPPPETDEQKRERKAAARRLMATWADNVRRMAEGVPAGIADGIANHVAGLHHSKVNDLVAEGEFTDELPPSSHIDARRMGAVVVLLHRFAQTGDLPEGVSTDG